MTDDAPKSKKSKSSDTPPTQPSPSDLVAAIRGSNAPVELKLDEFVVKAIENMPPRKGRYGKGYIADKHDKSKDASIRSLLGALRTDLLPAEAMDMEQFITGIFDVKDQDDTSRCLAYVMARAAQLRCALLGIPLKEFPSVDGLYTVARAFDRADQGFMPAQAPLTDNGSIPYCMVQGANQYGVALESQWPSDDLSKINDEPKLEQLEASSAMKFPGYYRISSTGAQRLMDVMQAIANGYPVLIGVHVDEAFELYMGGVAEKSTTPPIPKAVNAPDLTKDLGGHGLCLYGYKTFPGKVVLLRGCNSWGKEWGDNGLFWASAAWLQDDSVMDILVITCDPSHHSVAA